MKKVYFICGFIGAGKTTCSKKLAEEVGGFRFSIDEWMIPLYGEHMEREVFDARLKTLMALFKDAAVQLFNLGVPVIFDFGFWYKEERLEFKKWAEDAGAESELIYLDVDYDVCRSRAQVRNESRGDEAFEMTDEMLEMFWQWFEHPGDDESVTRIKSGKG